MHSHNPLGYLYRDCPTKGKVMDRYTDVDVICESALERSETFATFAEADAYAASELEQYAAEVPNASVEIYLTDHEHTPDVEECSCAQYVTDGRPYLSRNTEGMSYANVGQGYVATE